MKLTKSTGLLLLSVWLIVSGLSQLIDLPIPSLSAILSILAIAAGAFLIIGK